MSEPQHTICFDVPGTEDPVFAAWVGECLGITTSLADSARFESETVAQRTLENGYGPGLRDCGVVVEVGR